MLEGLYVVVVAIIAGNAPGNQMDHADLIDDDDKQGWNMTNCSVPHYRIICYLGCQQLIPLSNSFFFRTLGHLIFESCRSKV